MGAGEEGGGFALVLDDLVSVEDDVEGIGGDVDHAREWFDHVKRVVRRVFVVLLKKIKYE